jgi:hypothetical protein
MVFDFVESGRDVDEVYFLSIFFCWGGLGSKGGGSIVDLALGLYIDSSVFNFFYFEYFLPES